MERDLLMYKMKGNGSNATDLLERYRRIGVCEEDNTRDCNLADAETRSFHWTERPSKGTFTFRSAWNRKNFDCQMHCK